MHGTTMIFLVVMPVLFGLVNYVLPLQIGARDMAFPRLNAFGFWCVPFGGILLHFSVLAGGAPAVGWFSYAPLSETPYSSSPGVDYWAVAIFVLGIGSLSFAINTIATVISLRGPGMTMRRLPLFTWINFVNAFIIIFALASLKRRPGDDPDRSPATGSFLSTHWRRFTRSVATYLLGVRSPGSLHPGPSRIRNRLRNHSGFFAETDFRLRICRCLECCHRSPKPGRLGTSHVHRRDGSST